MNAIARAVSKARQEAITALTGIQPILNLRPGYGQMRGNTGVGSIKAGLFGTLLAFGLTLTIGKATLLDNLAGAPAGRQIIGARGRTFADNVAVFVTRTRPNDSTPIAIFFRITVTGHNLDQLHGFGTVLGLQVLVKGHTGRRVKTPACAVRNDERAEILRFQAFHQFARRVGNLKTIIR